MKEWRKSMVAHPHALKVAVIAFSLVSLCVLLFTMHRSEARYISTFSDLLSDSAPSEYSNHTIEFQIDTDLPPGGYISITPQDGAFTIPAADFDADQVELYVAPPALPYALRVSSSTGSATEDGVAITTGTSGNILLTLNSTDGITSGSDIRIKIGTHTTNSTTTDVAVLNPVATGTMAILIEAGGGADTATARALVAITDNIGVGPADTRELVPPVRSEGLPQGTLSGTTLAAEVSLETDEFSTCKYSTSPDIDYSAMSRLFTSTGSIFHSIVITGLVNETTYSFYVRCTDDENNFNIDDYLIEFTVPAAPEGTPADGDGSSGSGGTGSGSGSSGSGGGSSSGSGDSSRSGGGGGGGGSGAGGPESSDGPYKSGDATVIISGFAFPQSDIVVLVDGEIAEDGENASSNGAFSVTLPAIARGAYTFGVYAIDKGKVKSSTFSTTFTVTGALTSTLSNIHLMPTIKVAPNPVEPGTAVVFSGYAIPNSTVSIETQPDKGSGGVKTGTATSDSSGAWSSSFDTSGYARATWKVRAKSEQATGGISTNFSQYTMYGVGAAVAQAPVSGGSNSDLNRDGKVNLIDFSILLFHWNTAGGTSNPPADINRDGKVNLTDFSIMIFNWTG